jgi:glycosidase
MSDYPSELAAYAPCMDSLFDFPQAKRLLAALPSVSDSGLARDRAAELALLTGSPGFVPAVFLSNHDQDRSMGVLLSRSGVMGTRGWGIEADDAFAKAKETALARAKMAATALFTLGGMPVVYYGEELGMTGRRFMGDDVARRDAFIWNDERNGPPTAAWAASSGKIESGQNSNTPSLAAQALDPGSLFSHYSRLSELMRARKALQGGSWSMPEWAGFQAAGIVAYSRTGGGERLLVLHNLSLEAKDLPLPEGMSLSLVFQNSRGAQEPSPTGPAIRSSLRIPPLDSMVFSY